MFSQEYLDIMKNDDWNKKKALEMKHNLSVEATYEKNLAYFSFNAIYESFFD